MSTIGNYDDLTKIRDVAHDADIEISLGCVSGKVTHRRTTQSMSKYLRVISYEDGMVIGCTFISNEALNTLWKYHQDYLNREHNGAEHQGE